MSNDTPNRGNQNYREVVTTATFRFFDRDHTVAKEIKAKGFESQLHAWNYFEQQVGRVTFELGRPVWCASLSATNGDFLCQSVPRYWESGVVEVA